MFICLLSLQLGLILWSGVGDQHTAEPRYYDVRERVATTMTFVWQETCQVRIPLERIKDHNAWAEAYIKSLAESTKTSIEILYERFSKMFIDEKVANMVFDLSYYYVIERTPQQTRIRTQKQAIDLHHAKVVGPFREEETYLQGNRVIKVYRGLSDGQVTVVYLAQCEEGVVGLGSPFRDVQPESLVIQAGVSPFRLYGRQPEDWRLVSVSPEEWIFELPREPKNEPNEQEDEAVQNNGARPFQLPAPYVRFHLDRRYQDLLSRLEIRYPDGTTYTWRTLRYKRIESVWFPTEVELTVKHSLQETVSKIILVSARRTKEPIQLRIPEKTPVYDYRHLGLRAWLYWGEYKQTEWSESLLDPSHQF